MKDKLGRLNLELCVEKNVPPGPLLGKLKSGLDITLDDGTCVRAVDVKDPDEPGAVFISKYLRKVNLFFEIFYFLPSFLDLLLVIDCPSVDYLDSLLGEELFRSHQLGAKKEDIPKYIIHFTPSSVMQHEK